MTFTITEFVQGYCVGCIACALNGFIAAVVRR